MTWAGILGRQAGPDGRQVFRSPIATLIWWIWVLFAVGNLIDLAVQGRDHLSVIAACTLLVITGVVYATAKRPRIIADDDGLTIVNPVREHRIGWPAVVGFDSTELLRVRCLWTREDGTESDMRAIYAWAAHSSRRRQVAAEMRAQRRSQAGSARARFGGFGSLGSAPIDDAPPPVPLGIDVDVVMATLTERVEQVRSDAIDVRARRPVSTWSWPALAAVLVPVLALVLAVLL
ncbi:MAG TPA: PH domain-containing protein [Trebonia sp.]|nr:PH domain-containing protein [Trebonia sp.]